MPQRNKGFTLIELMVTIAVLVIVVSIAVTSFSALMAKNRADTDTGDFYRALNYARLEAINRGVSVRVTPSSGWASILRVTLASDLSSSNPLRVTAAMSTGASITSTVNGTTNTPAYIEFNNLGAMVFPASALVFTYTNGTVVRNLVACVNGRVILNNGNACT